MIRQPPTGDKPETQGRRSPVGPSGGFSKNWWTWVLAILVAWNVISLFTHTSHTKVLNLPYSAFLEQVQAQNVTEVTFQANAITGKLKKAITYPPAPANAAQASPSTAPGASTPASSAVPRSANTQQPQTSDTFASRLPDFGDPALLPALEAQKVQITANPDAGTPVWVLLAENLLPWVLFIGVFLLISRRAGQGAQGIFSFGKSKAKLYTHPDVRITFDDVAGVDEAKADLQDIIDFLRNPAKYQRLGGRIPHGVLLVGPAGTGKTLLAKAAAGEANVPFFSISGSEFVEMLVGVGASRVRDLFEQAKKQEGPSIIFIDEIDAVGRRRGIGAFGSNEEREQTLNQILVEMDGFNGHSAIVVLAATNRADVLDPALLRPGRFDRQVTVDPPERAGREAILRVHAKKVPIAADVDFAALSRATAGMVGADLANLVNEAALLAARRSLHEVGERCFLDALEKIQLGAARPLVLSPQDRRTVAYHEAGHALVALLSPEADPLNRVTIVPR
ncbi:MAG: ATP-dependent metallopeptidase FtsH/Yme1/Tma family protein, partial [Chloroflexota bacterium]|nr:ATP-dependent metallopeptidase FtsH/Yme1/Tma family protein [Chloroflexota bacterium]